VNDRITEHKRLPGTLNNASNYWTNGLRGPSVSPIVRSVASPEFGTRMGMKLTENSLRVTHTNNIKTVTKL